jgi:hypothetical protein
MKVIFLQILLGFLSYASIQANSQNHPICYICGSESEVVTNPNAVISIPDDYDSSINKVDCGALDESGKDGKISEEECMNLHKSNAVKNFCGCQSSTIEEDTSKPSDEPVPIARPSLNKNPVASPSATPIVTKLPTTSPAFYTEDVKSVAPSASPSDAPSDAPSSVPSHTPSDVPSEIPSSEPSLGTNDISGVDSSTDISGSVGPPTFLCVAMGVIVAMSYLSCESFPGVSLLFQ